MKWAWSSIFAVAAVLLSIAVIVLFIISVVSQTPFNMNTRSEGLLVCFVLVGFCCYLMGAAMYTGWTTHQAEKEGGMMGSGKTIKANREGVEIGL
jgi:hypothetical protein